MVHVNINGILNVCAKTYKCLQQSLALDMLYKNIWLPLLVSEPCLNQNQPEKMCTLSIISISNSKCLTNNSTLFDHIGILASKHHNLNSHGRQKACVITYTVIVFSFVSQASFLYVACSILQSDTLLSI